MIPFDKNEALRRARMRLARRSSVSKSEAEQLHAREYMAILEMDRVVAWARSKGLTVYVHPKIDAGRFNDNTRSVEVSSRFNPEKQLIVLLHELGHFLVGKGNASKEKFPNGYNRIDEGESGRDVLHKVDVIAEEFEAWHRGWKLACRLKIVIDRVYYDTVRADYLKSYFRWALKRGRVSDE